MPKEQSTGSTPVGSPSPSPYPETAAASVPIQKERHPTTKTKSKRTKATTSTPQSTGLRAPRTTPTTTGPRQPSIHNTRATARKVESTTRISRSGGGGPITFSLSRDAAGMSPEEIVREIGGRIALAESENIFDRQGGSTSLFDPHQKALDEERKRTRKKRSKKTGAGPSAASTGEVGADEKKKKKKKKSDGKWLEKKPGETPEKTYSSSPTHWEGTLQETPTKSTVRGDEAKWLVPAADSPPEPAFKRGQDDTPTKAPKRKNKSKKLLEQMQFPLPPGWWDVLKMTDNQRDLYIQLFEDSAEMTEESQYQLWNTALDIVYLAGEEEGTWGSDPQREKKLLNWRAEMIYKHDLTIPPPISWNQKQLAVELRPTNEERREYTKNFHTMYNNSYFWRILDQAWDKGCLEKCLEANNAIWELKLKYRDFPWFCLPLPSEKWRTHTSQYIPKPSKNYCQWVIGLLDFGLMNFGDAEQIRISGFRPVEREGAFEDSCHRAWLANAEYLPEGATNPLDDSDEDSDATSRSDTPQVPEPELTPEPELEIVEHNYYNGPAESQDSDSENATTDESEAAEEDGEADQEDDEEAAEETRQVGFKSKRGAESLTNAGKRTRVGN